MTMQSTNFTYSYETLLKNLRINTSVAMEMWPDEYRAFTDVGSWENRGYKSMSYEGVGALPEKPEGADPQPKALVEGYLESSNAKSYAYSMPITYEMQLYKEGNSRILKIMGDYASRSIKLTKEYASVNMLSNGFAGAHGVSGATMADGVYYFSASHLYKVGTSYSNLISPADISKTSLEACLKATATQVMEYGISAALRPKMLIYGTDSIFTVPYFFKSDVTTNASEALNTFNIFSDYRDMRRVMSHHNADVDMWAIDAGRPTRLMKQPHEYAQWATKEKNGDLVEVTMCAFLTVNEFVSDTFGNAGS